MLGCLAAPVRADEPVDFLLPSLEGPPRRLSDLRGQPVIVTFWAFWCWTWEEVHLGYVDLAQQEGAHLVTVSVDCQRTEQLRRVAPGPYERLIDPGSRVSTAWGVKVVPTVVVLDAAGYVRARFEGYPGNRELRECLRGLRSERRAAGVPAGGAASGPALPASGAGVRAGGEGRPASGPGSPASGAGVPAGGASRLVELPAAGPAFLSLRIGLLTDSLPADVAERLVARASDHLRATFGVELLVERTGGWRFPPGATDPRLVLARHVPDSGGPVLVLSGQQGVFGSGAASWPRALVMVGSSEDEAVAMICHEVSHWFGARDFADERYPEPSVMNYRDPRRGVVGGRVVWDSENRRRIEAGVAGWR